MKYAISSDHAGYPLKQTLGEELLRLGHHVVDLGTDDPSIPSDYPDAARAAGEAIMRQQVQRAVLICGSGVGASVAANKMPGIRAAICHDTFSAHQGVEDDDMNVLCLGARIIGPELALEVLRAFERARFSEAERHVRRLNKVQSIERQFSGMTEAHLG